MTAQCQKVYDLWNKNKRMRKPFAFRLIWNKNNNLYLGHKLRSAVVHHKERQPQSSKASLTKAKEDRCK